MSGKKEEIVFRCIGFREVWSLLDLDRFDEILLEDMHRTNEKINTWLIELYSVDSNKSLNISSDEKPSPLLNEEDSGGRHKPVKRGVGNIGTSLGKMDVQTAKQKFL
jgi:hypothetical protein